MLRDSKKPTLPPRTRGRTTRRSHAAVDPEAVTIEPSTSNKPTRRDLSAAIADVTATARGQFSTGSARSVAVDVVSGSIEVDMTAGRRRRRTNTAIRLDLIAATKREITVRVRDETITLDRAHALALAELITSTFD
jgi:hypothetical protein